jgi:hypothetical protein
MNLSDIIKEMKKANSEANSEEVIIIEELKW